MTMGDLSGTAASDTIPPSSRTILVVDDEESVGSLLAKLLVQRGHNASYRLDGPAALEVIEQGGVDLLITDVHMPGMDGLEVMRRARKIDGDLDIIVITGYGTMEIVIEAMREGAFDFIVKPIEKELFLKTVERALEMKSLKASLVARTEQLVQSEKMATVGILSAGIAHEINNPTTYIRTNLQLFREYIKRLLPRLDDLSNADNVASVRNIILNEFPKMIEEALKGTERIQKIVSGVRHYAHTSKGTFDETVDIREVISQSVTLVRAKLRKHVTINESYRNLKEIKGQFARLEQVFVNLLINAADAIEEKIKKRREAGDEEFKGAIDVSATIVEGAIIDGARAPDYLTLTFHDNGCGVPKENLTRVFDPFFTTKPVGQGTGLGLYICYEIIKQHHGDILIQSSQGEGTAFIMKLPVDGAATKAAEPAEKK